MNRDDLISQVKSEYSRLADMESREGFRNQTDGGVSPEAYYEKLLSKVINGINAGRFDDCGSGLEIVEAVANHKSGWTV